MNIFYLHDNPKTCAKMHNDKHVVKMILEYAQLLSTTHRVLDGVPSISMGPTGRRKTDYVLTSELDGILYRATHVNHPSAVWARQSYQNYVFLHNLLYYLCKEYTHRYGKVHKVERDGLLTKLYLPPLSLHQKKDSTKFTEPTPAMPDDMKVLGDSISSYRNYYNVAKSGMASWKKREIPEWYSAGVLYTSVKTSESQNANL